MPQTFLDYGQQVEKLIVGKELIVNNKDYAVEMLTKYSYFSLFIYI